MSDHRPVWLSDDDRALVVQALNYGASLCERGSQQFLDATAERDARTWRAAAERVGADPEPWLTVDDEGRVWRVWEIPDDDRYKYEYGGYDGELDREIDVPLYRLVPVDETGEG